LEALPLALYKKTPKGLGPIWSSSMSPAFCSFPTSRAPGPPRTKPLPSTICISKTEFLPSECLAVSPKRRRLALELKFRTRNLTGLDVRAFLKGLLRHLKGPVVLLWDRGTIPA
jgi:hypothetical protein